MTGCARGSRGVDQSMMPASSHAHEPALLVTRDGRVTVITLNRPETGNYIDRAVAKELTRALDEAETDREINSVVLTASGERFCSGIDPGEAGADDLEREVLVRALFARCWTKPIVAAVSGDAIGGGLELVLMADVVVAAEHARFALPQVTTGALADMGGAFRLPAQLPKKVAIQMLLTGEHITGRRAYELGLVSRLEAASNVLASALDVARAIAALPPRAVQASKRVAGGIEDGLAPTEAPLWRLLFAESETLTHVVPSQT